MRAAALAGERPAWSHRVADLVELTKPRITLMVAVSAGIGLLLPAGGALAPWLVASALAGTVLLASGGSALNQVLERDTDRLMRRTADRPLPAGRMSPDGALALGVGLSISGLALLALAVNLLTALIGAVALAGYVFVYTPLKRLSPLATVVGAVPGALPPVMGWAAASGSLDAGAGVLFSILFLWQLPHFLAIAWMCRDDYRRAGFPMLPVLDPSGRRTARQMILWAAALLPVSLLPSLLGLSGATYFVGALALGLGFLACSVAFSFEHSMRSARRVLLASVVYLPAVLAVMVVDRL